MTKGSITVQTENIFPIIKKFLYSDHEIFLREAGYKLAFLVGDCDWQSNAPDQNPLRTLRSLLWRRGRRGLGLLRKHDDRAGSNNQNCRQTFE